MTLAFMSSTIVIGLVGTLASGCSPTTSAGDPALPPAQFAQPERNTPPSRVAGSRDERRVQAEEQRAQPSTSRAVGGGPTDTSPRWTPDAAVVKIAAAQCNRVVRCKDLGPGEKYASRSECIASVESERRNQMNETNCPRPISAEAMKSCLQALDDDDCESAMAAATRTNACQLMNLCVK